MIMFIGSGCGIRDAQTGRDVWHEITAHLTHHGESHGDEEFPRLHLPWKGRKKSHTPPPRCFHFSSVVITVFPRPRLILFAAIGRSLDAFHSNNVVITVFPPLRLSLFAAICLSCLNPLESFGFSSSHSFLSCSFGCLAYGVWTRSDSAFTFGDALLRPQARLLPSMNIVQR